MVSFLILFPVFGAIACWLAGKGGKDARNVVASAVTFIELIMCFFFLSYPDYELHLNLVAGEGLFIKIDGFRRIYLVILTFMWAMTTLASHRYFEGHANTERFYLFSLFTEGATVGVFLAGNLYTALIFFEIMSLASFTWVIQEETPAAIRAAETYLAVAVIGGLFALGGIFLIKFALGTTDVDKLYELAQACDKKDMLYAAGICVLVGFGAKAGCFPLHIWLPKAHPAAPAPASALLSGILTKSGIFGVIILSCYMFRGDPNWGLLILTLGVITMVLGALLALFSIDLKRTLACSSVSQIGFILVGLGMMGLLDEEGATIAARGSLLHMMNHSMFKLVLFMCAGVVYQNLHKLDLNDIRGFGKGKLMLLLAFVAAMLGITGFPAFTGYYSKTLLHESMAEYIHLAAESGRIAWGMRFAEGLFLLSGGCTVAYMLKLFVCLFVDKHPEKQNDYNAMHRAEGTATTIALFIPTVVLVVASITSPFALNAVADLGTDFFVVGPLEEEISFFSWEALEGALISISIGCALYFGFVRKVLMKEENGVRVYVNKWPAWLDLEELVYRPLLEKILPGALGFAASLFGTNRLSAPAAKAVLRASEEAAAVAGENKVLTPVAKGTMSFLKVFTHGVSDVPEASVFGMKRTLFRDRHPEEESERAEMLEKKVARADEESRFLRGNLSFALLLLCITVCAVLGYLFLRK